MIDTILKMMAIGDMIGVSKTIDIAKGINKTPLTLKEGYIRHKRLRKW